MTILALFALALGPLLVIASYFFRSKRCCVVCNLTGYVISMSIVGAIINQAVTGAYAIEHRLVENQYHNEIIRMIGTHLHNSQNDRAIEIVEIYHKETDESNFYRNSLHRVIEQSKAADQDNAPDISDADDA